MAFASFPSSTRSFCAFALITLAAACSASGGTSSSPGDDGAGTSGSGSSGGVGGGSSAGGSGVSGSSAGGSGVSGSGVGGASGAGTSGAAGSGQGTSGSAGSSGCASGTLQCGAACVNPSTDAANCGSCGKACSAGEVCAAGVCGCATGRTQCGATCADTSADPSNCGMCGKACATGQVCSNGACSTSCGAGQTACSGSCVTLSSDAANCGACGKVCSAGQTCSAGACACSGGQTNCSGSCKNLMTDGANCGACGMACGTGQTCSSGSCACASGQTNCSGSCKTLSSDAANCGMCGKACASGQTCSNGACTGGSTGGGVCAFASGLNVAWINFANDIPNPKIASFQTLFQNTHAAGGRVVRWWFHTNGTVTPGYDGSGKAKALQQSHVDGIKQILAAANAAGVGLNISLWSFDMLQANAGNAVTNNKLLLENDTNRQAYIDNYLTPLVTALKGTPGLYSYEIFNEPEGMAENGWATNRTTEAAVQKTVNWFAAAIHAADPNVLVTNGAVTFDYVTKYCNNANCYSDAALRAAGGKQGGILDYYEVHYYTSNGAANSCFTHSAASWKLDKKVVMGEFAAQTTDGVNVNNLYTNLYDSGYNGAWAWSYNQPGASLPAWPAMQTPMQNLINAHSSVGNCP